MAQRQNKRKSGHTIPGPVADSTLAQVVLKQPEHEERSIREYVEWQAQDETVTHVEKLAIEHMFDRKLDAWDVRTDKERYWVITNPTNLYSQKNFPSLDYTLSFHVGVTHRIMSRDARKAPDDKSSRLESAWRQWEQAADDLYRADEAEEFQAVGMRCRECLVAFAKAVASPRMVPVSQTAPKAADFVHWAELIADAIAPGQTADEVRGYLKSVSKSTWQLVNWLTHASNAVRFDSTLAVDAVQHLLEVFSIALIRHERGIPDRCPNCLSYRLTSDYRVETDAYVTLCETCGWNEPQKPSE